MTAKHKWLAFIGAVGLAAFAVPASRAQAPITEAYSREVVIVNSETPPVILAAASREAAVVNSETPPALTQAYSQETALINSETPAMPIQAFSHEAALVVSEAPPALTQAYSHEAALVVSESPIVDTYSREIAVYDGYYTPEAVSALRIAGGLQTATPANMDRFALALQLVNSNNVNLPTAVEILRIAATLNP